MMTMATPLSAVRTTLEFVLFKFCKGFALGGLRLHCLLCCCCNCLRILLTSDLSSSASWDGSLLAACSVEVM